MRTNVLVRNTFLLLSSAAALGSCQSSTCKCYPGDECWPSEADWNSLNSSVNGQLIKTIPLGQPCHDPYYNATECTYLQSQWQWEEIQ